MGLLVLISTSFSAQTASTYSDFPRPEVLWKTQIGKTTYRTQAALMDGRIYIGSNGQRYKDLIGDGGNGLYVLNARSGSIVANIAGEQWGDNDVNGVVALDGKVYFGNDNDEFFCADKNGDIVWRLPCSGDVEHAPSVLNRPNGKKCIVFATEMGEVRAVNPIDGSTIWVHYHPDFDGWKPGSNRFVFRVKNHISSPNFYFTPPFLADYNKDTYSDLCYTTSSGMVVLNGVDGIILSTNSVGSYYSPITQRMSRMGVELLDHQYVETADPDDRWKAKYTVKDLNGRTLRDFPELLETSLKGQCRRTSDGSILMRAKENAYMEWIPGMKFPVRMDRKALRSGREPIQHHPGYIQYSGTFMTAQTWECRGKEVFAVMVENNVHKESHARHSLLEIRDAITGMLLSDVLLPARSESTPMVLDTNGDGTFEILVGDDTGHLYCIQL